MGYEDILATDSLSAGKEKINNNFKHKGYNYAYLDSTKDLNTITEDCKILSLGAKNSPDSGNFLVDVKRFYTRDTQTPTFWGVQRAYKQYTTGVSPVSYTRTFVETTTEIKWSEWQKDLKSIDIGDITKEKYKLPYINNTKDLDTITDEGQYISINALNQPVAGAFKLDIKKYYSLASGFADDSQYFGTQTLTESNVNNEVKVYIRSFTYNSKNTPALAFSSWGELTSSQSQGTGSSRFTGKNIVIMGDSTVEFGSIPEILQARLGANVYDIGVGGTRMAYHTNVNYDAFSGTKIVDSLVSKNWDLQETAYNNLKTINSDDNTSAFNTMKSIDLNVIDYMVIQYGTNDYMGTTDGAVPLGVNTDTTSSTFFGAINYIVDKLQKANPKIKIVFVTPHIRNNAPHAPAGYSTVAPNADGKYLVEFVDAIKEIAEKYSLLAIDMYRTSGINTNTFSTYIADTVHPTQLGYEMLGNKIASFIESNF